MASPEEMTRSVLHWDTVTSGATIDRQFFDNSSVSVEKLAHEVAVSVESHVLTDSRLSKHRAYLHVPSSWWQMFKRDHFPKWAQRWSPVRTTRWFVDVDLREKMIFPEAKYSYPETLGKPVVVQHVEGESWYDSQ